MTSQVRPTSPISHADQDSFPNPLNTLNDAHTRPQSLISSPITDIISEDGEYISDPYNTLIEVSPGNVQGVTGPPGEAGLPPSRPSSISTGRSASRRWSQAPPSRRGGGLSTVGPSSVAGSTGTSSARPTTSASRTHVPSLTSHAFFRPMSSQRLQAQRGQRPPSLVGQSSINQDNRSESSSHLYRQSIGSLPTSRGAPPLGLHRDTQDIDVQLPPSRGTDFTDRDMPDRTTANSTPTGAETVRSRGESVTPLHRPMKPTHLDLAETYKTGVTKLPTPTKSPHSFRSSFILPSRGGGATMAIRPQGHEKLSSTSSSPRLTRQDIVKREIKKELGRNYQYFTGNTVFCWGGRLQNTRDRPINIATGLMVIVPIALFFAFSAPWIWHHISPAIIILFAYISLVCVSSFIHASVSDPGILPRNLHPFPPSSPTEDPLTVGPPTTDWTMVVSAVSKSQAMEVPTKYCKSCNIWRPPRAHHCRVCDNCIETQDHHCVWLNNCVGRRNYRYFFTFVSSCTILGTFLIAASFAHILVWRARERTTFGHAISTWRVPFAMALYAIIMTPYPASLWGYHVFLMARGETTREYLNSRNFLKQDRHRPFTQGHGIRGWYKNWMAVLCRPRPPTYLHFKKQYAEGDQRFGPRRGKRSEPSNQNTMGGNGGVEMMDVSTASKGFQGPTKLGLNTTRGDGSDAVPLAQIETASGLHNGSGDGER